MSTNPGLPSTPTSAQVAQYLQDTFDLLTAIVIEPGNTITKPPTIRCLAGGPVAWLVRNHDTVPHIVEIDSVTFKLANQYPGHPFPQHIKLRTKVDPNGFAVLTANIDQGFLGTSRHKGSLATYKYSITSFSLNGNNTTLDPDLDVIDPGGSV